MKKQIYTIREAIAQAHRDGYPITEYTLRHWIKTGELPVRYIGNRALVHYPTLVHYLCPSCNSVATEDTQNE